MEFHIILFNPNMCPGCLKRTFRMAIVSLLPLGSVWEEELAHLQGHITRLHQSFVVQGMIFLLSQFAYARGTIIYPNKDIGEMRFKMSILNSLMNIVNIYIYIYILLSIACLCVNFQQTLKMEDWFRKSYSSNYMLSSVTYVATNGIITVIGQSALGYFRVCLMTHRKYKYLSCSYDT